MLFMYVSEAVKLVTENQVVYRLICTLADSEGDLTRSELCRRADISRTSVERYLDDLVSKQLVKKRTVGSMDLYGIVPENQLVSAVLEFHKRLKEIDD